VFFDPKEEFRNKLTNRFSFYNWTNANGTQSYTAISIKSGWYNLLWDISLEIEKELAKDAKKQLFKVFEVYQKYGEMNFRNTYYSDNIERLLLEAEDRSNKICEMCGQLGGLREERMFILTLCDECNSKRNERFR
jgi:hypothetical protein